MKEALEYIPLPEGNVQCSLCPHNCIIANEKTGICRIRKNINGKLYSLVYGKASSIALDPIEKKPLFHFHPGSYILSLGTYGCNFRCPWCQNWSISQVNDGPAESITSEEIVLLAKRKGSVGIAYTYNEPLIWYEFVLDTAKLAKEEGLTNVLVTNGYINPQPLENLLPYIDAMNIDLKSISEEFYKKYCGAKLQSVLDTINIAVKRGILVELTNLLIPTLNDSESEIQQLVDWVAALNDAIPLHFSRYFPQYKFNLPATPVTTLEKAYSIASKKLKYVYLGNVINPEAESTYCPQCKNELIHREGYWIKITGIKDKKCGSCNRTVDIIF